jgi:nucleoid-associated protein YgaU
MADSDRPEIKMKRNGAVWVALAVVAVAAALMYFVVLPQMRGDKSVQELAKKAGEAVEQAKDTAQKTVEKAKDAAEKPADQPKDVAEKPADQAKDAVKQAAADPKAGILQKMARIKADGQQATVEFEALFAGGKQPTFEEIEAARAKLKMALEAASQLQGAEGLDAATAAEVSNASKSATQSLTLLGAMPNDPEGAKKAYNELKLAITAALNGQALPTAVKTDAQTLAKVEDVKPADKVIDVTPLDDTTAKPADNVEVQPADKAAEATDPNLPSFDVLRVEKDGSTVIAGHSTPGAKIDVVDGDKVIASTVAGAEGDFVVVLDDPLAAGDHQIVLQATGKDGKKLVSVEAATVSVPADKSGKLLAMVTKPGEASRIMEMPEADDTVVAQNTDQAAKNVTAEAKQEAVEPKNDTAAEAKSDQKPDAKPVDVAKQDDAKPADAAKQDEAKPAEIAKQEDVKPAEVAKQDEAQAEAKPVVTPALPDAANDLANTAPVVKQDRAQTQNDAAKVEDTTDKNEVTDIAKVPAKTADAAEAAKSDAATTTESAKSENQVADNETQDVAKAETDAAAKTETNEMKPVSAEAKPADKAMVAPEVLVNAVEIEGNKIFVAGSARPKSIVRVYADDKLVAEVSTDDNGRFVADNSLPLAVGNHTIRADVLSRDGKKVEFRASVPFFRPEGEQLAAVNGDTETTNDNKMLPLADGDYDRAREEAGKAVALLKGLYNAGRTPTLDELAAARSATEIALKTLSQIKLSDADDPVAKQMADKTAGRAAKALALLKSLPQDANAVKTALNSIDDAVTSAVAPAMAVATAKKPATTTEKAEAVDNTAISRTAKAENTEVAESAVKPDAVQDSTAADTAKANDVGKDTAADAARQTTEVASTDNNSQPKLIEQAPLKPSQSASVIIRHGDTLWQISRRVYGLGVRYTTIYLANEQQIRDPDRIMPGQVFGVPEKYLPNSEELHRERIEHKKH